MATVFRYAFARFLGQIIGWGLAILLLVMMIVPLYDVVMEQQAQFQQLVQNYPPQFSAFFGDMNAIGTPEGYLTLEFFSLAPIILGIFAILAGSGLLASDEEKGTLDLVLAHPVSRTALFLGRLLALVAAMIAILAIVWLAFIVAMAWSSLDVAWDAMALPLLSLLAVLLVFGTLALLLSMLLPSRRLAAMLAGVALIVSYVLTSLARIDPGLETIAKLSPLNYYQSGQAILGLDLAWWLGLLAVAALFSGLAWWRFERRDIRVGGEGGWRLPSLRRRPLHARPEPTTGQS